MITFPEGFDFHLLIADLLTLGIPIVLVSLSIFVYLTITFAMDSSDK